VNSLSGLLWLATALLAWRTLANLFAKEGRAHPVGNKPEFLAHDYYD